MRASSHFETLKWFAVHDPELLVEALLDAGVDVLPYLEFRPQ